MCYIYYNNVNQQLNQFLFNYRIASHSTTKENPASLLFGRNIWNRFDLLKPNTRSTVWENQEKQKNNNMDRHFDINEKVLVRKFSGKKWTKGKIVKKLGNVYI